MNELLNQTLCSVSDRIKNQTLSATDLTSSILERIDLIDPLINAFRSVTRDEALRYAEQLDRQAKHGHFVGPLHGIPIAVKDMFYFPGHRPSGGSAFLQDAHAPQHHSTVISRLKAAGAVIVGTLNMTEFAMGPTGHNIHTGACRNPYNVDHIAGGSSSGSAAAVAARLAFGSIGSDTGGSIRIPAAVNGVYGIKPTYGLVPRTGSMPLSYSLDTLGPLARHPDDLQVLLNVIAGADGFDKAASLRRGLSDTEDNDRPFRAYRIGIDEHYFNANLSPESQKTLDQVITLLRTNGASIVKVTIAHSEEHKALSRALFYSEAAAIHGHWLRDRLNDYSPQVGNRLLTGMMIPAMTYLEAQLLRPKLLRSFVKDVFDQCDVLLTPATPIAVPTLESTDAGGGPEMWTVIDALLRNAAGLNYLGVPALVTPIRLDAQGLPSSIQLVGRPFAETTLLRLATLVEEITSFSKVFPVLSATPPATTKR